MAKKRILSLDAFRGLTILGMLLVNNTMMGEYTPEQLGHAEWTNQVNFADLVFPWFLLIVGLSLPWSFAAFQAREGSWPSWCHKALDRSLKLFAIGCFLTSSIYKTPVISLGVLQLIALSYLVAAVLISRSPRERLLVAVGLLAVHWVVLKFWFVPEWGPGTFVEGHTVIDYWNQQYLSQWHLNGLWSVVPAGAMVILGSVMGEVALSGLRPLLIWGAGLTLVGRLLALDTPMLKPIWTSSYILFTAGLGMLTLGVLYLLTDVWDTALVWPLKAGGANAIFAYVFPIVFKVYVLWGWTVKVGSESLSLQDFMLSRLTSEWGVEYGGWLYTVVYLLMWCALFCLMHRKRIYWKV